MPDAPGLPEQTEDQDHRTPPDTLSTGGEGTQSVSFTTAQVAKMLGVSDSRTVRRYITVGSHTPSGKTIKLAGRLVTTKRGEEYLISQEDLEIFKAARDRAATQGEEAGHSQRAEEAQTQAITISYQILATELENRNQALVQAQQAHLQSQQTIERLAREAGRSEGLERELELNRQRIEELKQERDYWQTKATTARKSYRINLFPIKDE